MSNNFELVNRDGKLIAQDEDGNEFAVPIESLDTDEKLNGAGTPKPEDGAAGVNEAISDGATVTLHGSATYEISTPVQINASNVTLDLNGSTIKVADGANVKPIEIAGDGNHYEDITIKNGEIDGNGENQTDTSLRLHGIDIHDVRFVELEDLHIHDTYPDPILEDMEGNPRGGNGVLARPESEDVTIRNCRAIDCGYDSYGMTGTTMRVYESISLGQSNRSFSADWTEVGPGNDVRFVNCIGESGYYPASAFGVWGDIDGSDSATGFHVIGCRVFMRADAPDTGRRSIVLRAVNDFTVRDFEILGANHNQPSIRCYNGTSDGVIEGGFIKNSPDNGIQIDPDCSDISIVDTDIVDPGNRAIQIEGSGITIRGGTVEGTAKAIYVDSDGNKVVDVTIKNTSNTGVELVGHDNLVRGVKTEATTGPGVAITDTSADNVVSACRIINSSHHGIAVNGTANIIGLNRVSDSDNDDIYKNGTDNTYSGNLTGAAN